MDNNIKCPSPQMEISSSIHKHVTQVQNEAIDACAIVQRIADKIVGPNAQPTVAGISTERNVHEMLDEISVRLGNIRDNIQRL